MGNDEIKINFIFTDPVPSIRDGILFIIQMSTLTHWLEAHFMTCPYKALAGFDCPGCGMQRSFIELLKGNLTESLHLYPALLPTLLTLSFTALHLIFKFRNGAAVVKYSFITTIVIVLVSYFIKMIR